MGNLAPNILQFAMCSLDGEITADMKNLVEAAFSATLKHPEPTTSVAAHTVALYKALLFFQTYFDVSDHQAIMDLCERTFRDEFNFKRT